MKDSRKFESSPETRKVDPLMLVIRVYFGALRSSVFLFYDLTANRPVRARFTTKFTNVIGARLQRGETSRRGGNKVARVTDA